jgi:hypothetical protein
VATPCHFNSTDEVAWVTACFLAQQPHRWNDNPSSGKRMVLVGLHHAAPQSMQIAYDTFPKFFNYVSTLFCKKHKTRQIVALLNVIMASEISPHKRQNANYCHFSLYTTYLNQLENKLSIPINYQPYAYYAKHSSSLTGRSDCNNGTASYAGSPMFESRF